ncbi:50S ribosomal protein L24, partial [Vibrio parahaemolyticus]
DEVVVITGKDKGKRGTVSQVAEGRVVVSGINMVKKHVKPNPARNVQGGIVEQEASIDISNVALFNPVTQKADRVGYKLLE